jgi:hypothetical protein
MAKYYKCQFHLIPRLSKYDVVVWIDGTIELLSPNLSRRLLEIAITHPVASVDHPERAGTLWREVSASRHRYTTKFWGGQPQPWQDVWGQYHRYEMMGFKEHFFDLQNLEYRSNVRGPMGVWQTWLVSWSMRNPMVKELLNTWYDQILRFTTQDQVSFPFVIQKFNVTPWTFPDNMWKKVEEITKKWPHGR